MAVTILVADFRLPHARNVTNDSWALIWKWWRHLSKVRSLYNHDYYFSLVSWLPVHSWTCHRVVLLPCVKNHQLINLIVYRVKSEIFSVQSSSYFLHPIFLLSLPLFSYQIPYAHDIWYIPQFVLLCVLFCSCWLFFPDSPFSTRPAPIQPSKPQWSIISSGKPSLIFPSSAIGSSFSGSSWYFLHTSITCDFCSYVCASAPSGWRPGSPIFVSCHPLLCLAFTRPTEKAMAPYSSTLAWKIPWMEEPGGLQSMGSLRVGYD